MSAKIGIYSRLAKNAGSIEWVCTFAARSVNMKKSKEGKDFLHLPQYPGGKEAYQEFIRTNLKYPREAIENKIQGKVYVSYEVSDNGEVLSAQVTKGLGYGCDEEAIRLVKMMKYEKVKNRGVRLKSTIKTAIDFKLKEVKQSLQFNYVEKKKQIHEEKQEKKGSSYSYTIKY